MSGSFTIPSLSTDRLVLRAFNSEDLDFISELVSDPRVVQSATYSGETMTRSQAWNWLCYMVGHWHLRGFGIWGVEEKESGLLIGRIGLQYLDWFEDVELVWMLARSAWGKGYATEGARAAMTYGLVTLDLSRITAVIRRENKRSIKLAERLGMTLEKDVQREGVDFYQYAITSDQLS
jgi:RimJ/RimL family protein N-acetyltransferase